MTHFKSDRPLRLALMLFAICVVLRILDVFWIRSDAWFGEQFLTKAIGLGLVLLFAWRCAPIALRHIPVRQTLGLGVGVSLTVICGVALLLWGALQATGFQPSFQLMLEQERGLVVALAMLIGLNLLNAMMEEGLFRGVLLSQLASKIGASKANITQAVLFGLWHVVWPVRSVLEGDAQPLNAIIFGSGYVVVSALIGGYWGWLTLHSRSLWPAILAHGLNNAAMTVLIMGSVPNLPMIAIFTSIQAVLFVALIPVLRRASAFSPPLMGRKN